MREVRARSPGARRIHPLPDRPVPRRTPAPLRLLRGLTLLWTALLALFALGSLAAPAEAAWSTQTSALNAVIIGSTSCPTETDCVQVNNAGRFQYTTDGGTTWTASTANLTDSTWGMDCPTADTCFTTGDNGSIYKSTDHGATWATSFTGSPALYGIECPTEALCYVATVDGRIRKTIDGGASWTIGATQSTVGIYSISCPSTTVCFASTATGEVRRKQAGNDTWDLVASGAAMNDTLSPYTHAITCPSLTVCYLGATDGTIYRTDDGGATWPKQTTGTAPDVYAIDCFSITRCVAVGVANTSMFTDDGGTTWTTENTGSAAAMYSVTFARGDRAIAADALGVPYVYAAPALPSGGVSATASVAAGTLTFLGGTPANVVFPSLTLDGTDQLRTQAQPIAVSDATGSSDGWSITATSTVFASGPNRLPLSATVALAPPSIACAAAATCTTAVSTVPYPYALPADVAAPTATKMYNAVPGTGLGAQTVTPNWTLSVPSSTHVGTYTSTWTFTLVSGP